MKKTDVMFFFDTEDFTSETCADATMHLANLLTEEGVTGHFAVVGLLAEQFTNWGRSDVVKALKPHIIGTHTYGHTLHPTIAEDSEGEDYAAAYRRVYEKEAAALEMLKQHLGADNILFAVPPGNSMTYVALYVYRDLGIPYYCGSYINDDRSTLLDYSGITHIPYIESLEAMFFYNDWTTEAILDSLRSYDRVIIYTHPNITVKKEFWDALNYAHGNLREYGDWIEAEDRTPEEIQYLRDRFRELIRALKADAHFRITDICEVDKEKNSLPVREIRPSDLAGIREALNTHFYPPRDGAYSVAEVFHACIRFLKGEDCFYPADHALYGFLDVPKGISAPVTLSRQEITETARTLDVNGFLPSEISVGDKTIGPADFLFAMLDILTTDAKELTLIPREQNVMYPELQELCGFHMDSSNWMHAWDFHDEYVSHRLRLQSWTLRYCGI